MHAINWEPRNLLRHLKQNRVSAGCGPDGWSGYTLNYLASNASDTIIRLASFQIDAILNTKSSLISRSITDGCLMLIQKPDASYRPPNITLIEIMITRSVLRLLTLLDRGGIKSYFLENNQFGLHNTTVRPSFVL